MPELKIDGSLPIHCHSIADVAKEANCTKADLLKYGENGEIKIAIRPPKETVIFDVDHQVLDMDEAINESMRNILSYRLNGNESYQRKDIEMLFLSKADCSAILLHGNYPCSQSIFNEGWGFDIDSIRETIHPTRSNKDAQILGLNLNASKLGRRFVTYPKSECDEVAKRWKQVDRKKIELLLDRLYVTDTDLQCLLKKNNMRSEEFPPDDIFKVESYTSKKLEALHIASRRYWAQTNPEKSEEFKSINKKAKDWLMDHGFEDETRSVVQAAVIIICPMYARRNARQQEKKKSQGYQTAEFDALVKASAHWKNVDLEDMDTYPKRDAVVNSMIDSGLSNRLAQAGATIICPEKAKKGRRPTNNSKQKKTL